MCSGSRKLYIHRSKPIFRCFKCGEANGFKGKVEYFIKKQFDVPLEVSRARLFGIGELEFKEVFNIRFTDAPFGDILKEEEKLIQEETILEPTQYPDWFFDCNHPSFRPGMDYLLSRGIGLDTIQKYDIRYNANEKRVIFPIKQDGLLYGWQGRYIENTTILDKEGNVKFKIPKILTSGGISGGSMLMFQDNLKDSDQVFLTEGPFDCLKSDLIKGNCASMGKSVTNKQIATILAYNPKRLYLALDPDAASDMNRIMKEVAGQSDLEVYVVQPPSHRADLGECTKEEVLQQYEQAVKVDSSHIFIYFNRNK